MLPPSAIAGVSVVCALGPWVFTQPMVLRVLAAAAAATAIGGAVVMRHWDTQAGKRVADLTRARASDEWRFEERIAELESDLEESRELRAKLEQRLRAKRAELAGLRNEHAALLRRYAASEVDRASVLEERRVLEIEAAVPARALPAGPSVAPDDAEASAEAASGTEASATVEQDEAVAGEAPAAPSVFSPEGSKLFLRADAALARLADAADTAEDGADTDVRTDGASGPADDARTGDAPKDDDAPEGPEDGGSPKGDDAPTSPEDDGSPKGDDAPEGPEDDGPESARRSEQERAQEGEAEGQAEAVDEHERTTASPASAASPAQPALQPSGHFTVPTAVAVVPPTAPVRRPVSEGGFDFFGTKKDTDGAALDAVQNEDLADVVGQEALALHKADAEARFKPADEEARGVGQVIDLTAHDETEHIDVEGLRSASA
jgi:TolA-binding protein